MGKNPNKQNVQLNVDVSDHVTTEPQREVNPQPAACPHAALIMDLMFRCNMMIALRSSGGFLHVSHSKMIFRILRKIKSQLKSVKRLFLAGHVTLVLVTALSPPAGRSYKRSSFSRSDVISLTRHQGVT